MENNLSIIDGLGSVLNDQRAAAAAAQFTENLSMGRYKQGAVGYLDVVVAQTASLRAQRSVLELQTQQLAASVALIGPPVAVIDSPNAPMTWRFQNATITGITLTKKW